MTDLPAASTATPTPSLENLRKQAKTLLKAWQCGDSAALARIHAVHPQRDDLKPHLSACQFVIARELGFRSWPQLKVAKEAAALTVADQFVSIGCLCHDDPHYDHRSFHVRAHAMLRENPELGEAHVWSAATAGDVASVRRFIDRQPQMANQPGPYGWVPLICACYSRVEPIDPRQSIYEVAKLLLDRGADPNAFTMKGNADERLDPSARRFTALTGVFGGGSTGLANQPPHPRWRELAELLLGRGADPADEQALQINQDASLELLLQHGLRPDAMGSDGVSLMGRALFRAARRNRVDQVRLLLANHARTDERVDGQIPWEVAMQRGNAEIARSIEAGSGSVAPLDDVAWFVSACMAGDEVGARGMLARSPDLKGRSPKAMVHRAVSTARKSAVELVLKLGFDPNYQEDNAAIMEAGILAEHEEILRLLLDYGASLKLRDPWYDSTGIGWADFFDFPALRDRLLDERDICLFDALDYDRLDRVADIVSRDPGALNRPFAECISRAAEAKDWVTPVERMMARGNAAAVKVLVELGAMEG